MEKGTDFLNYMLKYTCGFFQRFSDWKNATRSKFREIQDSQLKTSGRPCTKLEMTSLEERGLAVWGQMSVAGSCLVVKTGGFVNATATYDSDPKTSSDCKTYLLNSDDLNVPLCVQKTNIQHLQPVSKRRRLKKELSISDVGRELLEAYKNTPV